MAKKTDAIKFISTSYLGRKALRREVRKAGAFGERVVLTHWVESSVGQKEEYPAGSTTMRRVKGNERRGTLVILEAEHVVDNSEWYKANAEFFSA